MWHTKKLNEVCDIQSGLWKGKKGPYTTALVLRNTNFTASGVFDYSNVVELEVEAKQLANREVIKNDIILEKSGGGDKTPVGRVCIHDKESKIPFSLSNFTARIRVLDSKELNAEFLHKFLYFLYISGKTEPMQRHSTGIRNLQLTQYKDIDVPLPPIAEQERIAAKLDAAFAEIDEAAEANIKKLSLTEDAFGKIVDFELNQLNKKFQSCSLGEMLDGVQYGTSTKCSKSGKYPVLRMGNMQFGKFILDDFVYLDDEDSFAKYKVYQGDVFFNRTNSAVHVGKAAILESDEIYLFAGYLIRLNYSRDKIDGNFLNYFLNAPSIREHGFSVMTSSVNQANINGTKLKAYPFLNIDIETQRFLSKKLKKIEYELLQSKNLLKKILNNYTKLKSSILAQELQSSEAA